MKKNLFVYLLSGLFVCMGFISCDDKDDDGGENVLSPISFYVLCRGNQGQNNASLGYYDAEAKEYIPDYFALQNGEKLGELAEDMLIYGGKMYITVTGSNSLIITDLKGKIQKVVKPEGDQPLEPRCLVANGKNVFVSYWKGHSVAVLDTTTMAITATIPVGRYPEQLAVSRNKLFVTNSGGLDGYEIGEYGNTISVINLSSLTKEQNIEVMSNPTKILANSQGDLYVISMGDYSEEMPSTLQKISGSNYNVEKIGQATAMCLSGNVLYTVYSQSFWDMETNTSKPMPIKYIAYNATTGKIENGSYINNTSVQNPNSLNVNPVTGNIYINDQDWVTTNDLYIFDANGNKTGVLETEGYDVAKVIFYP